MDWRPYKACCQKYASDAEIAYCPDCAHPLMRCSSFAECQSLVSPGQPCPACVSPALMIEAGAVVQPKTGERMSLPFVIHNLTSAARPIFIKRLMKRDGQSEEPVPLTWEQIDPGTERRFSVDTPPSTVGGTHTIRLLLVVATRNKGVEEEFAFEAEASVKVTGPDTKQVVQNNNFTGAVFGTGGMVNTAMRTTDTSQIDESVLKDRTVVFLSRAEKYELEHGIRGYRNDGIRVPRSVDFSFEGFRSAESPDAGTSLVTKPRLAFGRNSRTPDPAANTVPSDVTLRVYDPRSGDIEEAATMAISRHHFDLLVVNDRLCVQARTTRGMQVNDTNIAAGEVVPVGPGDRIVPIPGRAEKLSLQVVFSESIGSVDRVTVSRTPALK